MKISAGGSSCAETLDRVATEVLRRAHALSHDPGCWRDSSSSRRARILLRNRGREMVKPLVIARSDSTAYPAVVVVWFEEPLIHTAFSSLRAGKDLQRHTSQISVFSLSFAAISRSTSFVSFHSPRASQA
jgi:hypothetical protein